MATFNISTNTNIDSLTSKAGDDTYNVNGAVLTIDQDSRYGQNQTTSSILGQVIGSSTLGGSIVIDGTMIRLIPYDGGSGNVPAYNTTISGASGSGLMIGVYDTNLDSAPVAPGDAMPSSGYIKIKQWNEGAFVDNESLTGVTATVCVDHILGSGTDRVGWLQIVGQESRQLILYRLNNPTQNLVEGDWFQLGTTTGTRSTTYQIPSQGQDQYHAGVQVETDTPGVYEWYAGTESNMLDTVIGTEEWRGKFCSITPSTGLLRFGHDGTNSSGGYCPPAGRKIRIPNVFLANATSASKTANSLNSTPATRYRVIPTNSGRVYMSNASCNWQLSFNTAYAINFKDMGVMSQIYINNPTTPPVVDGCCVGQYTSNTNAKLQLNSVTVGATVTDTSVTSTAPAGSNTGVIHVVDSAGVDLVRVRAQHTGTPTSSTQYGLYILRSNRTTVTDPTISYLISQNGANDTTIENTFYYHSAFGKNAQINWGGFTWISSNNSTIDEITIPDGMMPRGPLFSSSSSCSDITIRNLGSYADPVLVDGYDEEYVSWARSGTVATVTTTSPHGLSIGDLIFVYTSSSPTAITLSGKTITGVPSSTTFTFTSNSSGDTSGKLSFYQAQSTYLLDSSTTTNLTMKNVHVRGLYTRAFNASATNSNVEMSNVSFDPKLANAPLFQNQGHRLNSIYLGDQGLSGQSSIFGTLSASLFLRPVAATGATGVSYSRSVSLVTVTSPGHGLITGDSIVIYDSGFPAAQKDGRVRTVTVLDEDTFTYGGQNIAGTSSGTLDYDIYDSKYTLFGNEPDSSTSSLVTFDAGTPAYTGSGSLAMTPGDQVTITSEREIIGFKSFAIAPVYASTGVDEHLKYTITYDLNRGSGYSGVFKNLNRVLTTASGTAAGTTITVDDTTGVAVGDYVFGYGVAQGAKIASIDSGTQITLDTAHDFDVSDSITLNAAPNESNIGDDGIKMKIRILCVASPSAAWTFLDIPMVSDDTTRARLYPQAILGTQTVTISNGVAGTRLQIYDLTSNTELYNDVPSEYPFTWADPNGYVADREIRVRAAYVSGATAKEFIDVVIGTATSTEMDLAYRLNQVDDTVYNTNAVDGSTVTDVQIVDSVLVAEIDTGELSWAELYAYEAYWLSTELGIEDEGQLIHAIDPANYLFDDLVITNVTSPEVPLIMTGGYARNMTSLETIDVFDTGGGRIFNAPDHVVAYATGSGVTSGDISTIRAGLALEATSTEILSNTDATQAKVNEL